MHIPLLNAEVNSIALDPLLFTVQQIIGEHDAMKNGSSRINTMNQAQRVVDVNAHFHAYMSFVPLFSLVHLRVASASLAICRVGGRDNRRIYDATFP